MSSISGARLRTLREEKGETQLQISQLLGFKTKQAYSAVEAERDLSFENLLKIAEHFGVTTDYIIGASPYRTVKEEKLALQTTPNNPHDPATVAAITIKTTAEFLLEKYRVEGKPVQDRHLGPLASLCEIIKEHASSVTYAGDTISGDNFDTFWDMASGETYRKVNEACQRILKEGF